MPNTEDDSKSWARKYRPKSLEEYMGSQVKQTLNSRFSDPKRMPQTILLEGPRGTGKTTAARLLAKEYQCLDKVDGHACGKCDICLELDEKLVQTEAGMNPIGVSEIDIATEGSKANIDDIISDALMEPMPPMKYKILILDEFHMASTVVQNRLLKVMEEPPRHLVIILCTTNPEKILGTILSRCQVKIEVHKADVEELAGRLLYICKQERVETSMAALRVIAKQEDRVPREAIMLLERIALSNGYKVDLAAIQRVSGTIASEVYLAYYKAANKDLSDVVKYVATLKEMEKMSFKKFISGLTRFTLDAINIKYGIGLENFAVDYVKAISELFKMYNTEEMDCLLQIIEYANRMMGSDSDTKEELVVITTAMRIGRVKLLNQGLSMESTEATRENKRAGIRYAEQHNAELESMNHSARTGSVDAMVATVFGKETVVIERKPVIQRDTPSLVDDTPDRPAIQSEEDFLKMFDK